MVTSMAKSVPLQVCNVTQLLFGTVCCTQAVSWTKLKCTFDLHHFEINPLDVLIINRQMLDFCFLFKCNPPSLYIIILHYLPSYLEAKLNVSTHIL